MNEGEGCRDQTTWALQDSSRTKTGNWGALAEKGPNSTPHTSIRTHIPCFVASETSEESQGLSEHSPETTFQMRRVRLDGHPSPLSSLLTLGT